MKLYIPIDVMIVLLNTTKPTFDKWVWKWMKAIAMKHVDMFVWTNRFRDELQASLVALHVQNLVYFQKCYDFKATKTIQVLFIRQVKWDFVPFFLTQMLKVS